MPVTHLVVTPLPNGRSGSTLHLSVHLSPRLRAEGTLADYPDVADWGAFVAGPPALGFQPLLNGVVRPGVTTTVVSPPVDPAVWRAVFGPPADVPVQPFRFRDRSAIDLSAIDSGDLSERVMAVLRAIAALGATSPTAAEVVEALEDLSPLLPAARDHHGPIGDGQEPLPPSDELHDQLGPLTGHPHLMRLLGLVYDLEIALPPGGAAITEVAVRTSWATQRGLGPRAQVPMRIAVDADFRAVVRQPEYREVDWLRFGGAKYAVAQLDLVDAVQQMGHLDEELARAETPDGPVEVPALLESGLSVVCGDLGDVLRDRLVRQREVEDGIDAWLTGAAPRTPLLDAEDTALGFRCDVLDLTVAGAPYRSLHQRQVPTGYQLPRDKDLVVRPPVDEGWNSIALSTDGREVLRPRSTALVYSQEGSPQARKVEEDDETGWRVDDHIVTWGGWSLSTPRVGASSNGSGEVTDRAAGTPPVDATTQVEVAYAPVDRTLPKLRYGRTYQLRARCVDLAGNGPALADAAPGEAESPATRYGRLTPLSPPLLVRRESRPDPGVGDQTDVLVIRSELEQADGDTPPTDRLLFPPRTSQSRLERHDLPNGGTDPRSYAVLAGRDAVSLLDQTAVDPETGELVAGTEVVDGQVAPGPLRPPVGYLADPAAAGVALIGLPGGGAVPLRMTYGTWPTFAAADIELRAGTGAPVVGSADRRITAFLPKGTVADVEVSSTPHAVRLEHLAFGQGLGGSARTTALRGENRVLSPRHRMRLVHAVRIPLAVPRLEELTATRTEVGRTDVLLEGALGLHRATTDHVVLRSRWVDPVDDLSLPEPTDVITKRVARDLQVPLVGDGEVEVLPPTALELGDTRRREVTFVADAFCRFSRYFTERVDFEAPAPGDPLVLHPDGVAPPTVEITRLDDGARLRRGEDFAIDRERGELTLLTGSVPAGTPCRAHLLPLPVSRRSTDVEGPGASLTVDVPASTAPVPPTVLTALPAFAREVTETADRITVDHDGRVVRLHLARPWWSSGIGELLGVAVDGGLSDEDLTRWGRDPRAGRDPGAGPVADAFPLATEVAVGVDGRCDVAGHGVTFDGDRGLWTADVLVDAAGYRPFVHLRVCRFQPHAVDGQHLSGIVEVEPLRLGASRRVVVTNRAGDDVEVSVSGPDDVNQVTVVLQEADPAVDDPDLRWRDVSSTVLTRRGSTAAATHEGIVVAPSTGAPRRLLVEDAEPVTIAEGGALVPSTVVAYREVVEIPEGW